MSVYSFSYSLVLSVSNHVFIFSFSSLRDHFGVSDYRMGQLQALLSDTQRQVFGCLISMLGVHEFTHSDLHSLRTCGSIVTRRGGEGTSQIDSAEYVYLLHVYSLWLNQSVSLSVLRFVERFSLTVCLVC